MYDMGRGVTQDYKEAVSWFRKAAEQGDVIGLSKLGEYYEYGKGMEANYSEALRLYKKAAEQGDDESKKAVNRLSEKKWGLKNLQLLLTKRGFDPGPIDGKLNPKTMKAVQKFHDATSLDVGKYNIMAIHTYLSRQINKAIPSLK
jgi:TPR repeat protein